MQYYVLRDNTSKWWGVVSSAAYIVLCVLLMFLIRFPLMETFIFDEGVMINFGDVEIAGGDMDTAMADIRSQRPAEAFPGGRPTEAVTSPDGEVAVPRAERERETQNDRQTEPTEQPRQADPRALFPGRTVGSTSESEGTGTGPGNQGNPAGSPDGSHSGTGTGTSGTSFNLAGRSTVGALPKPAYDGKREGKVVIEITVNPSGTVTNAVYRAVGSTTNESSLIEVARKAALQARFNVVGSDNMQVGTITYIFKME